MQRVSSTKQAVAPLSPLHWVNIGPFLRNRLIFTQYWWPPVDLAPRSKDLVGTFFSIFAVLTKCILQVQSHTAFPARMQQDSSLYIKAVSLTLTKHQLTPQEPWCFIILYVKIPKELLLYSLLLCKQKCKKMMAIPRACMKYANHSLQA